MTRNSKHGSHLQVSHSIPYFLSGDDSIKSSGISVGSTAILNKTNLLDISGKNLYTYSTSPCISPPIFFKDLRLQW